MTVKLIAVDMDGTFYATTKPITVSVFLSSTPK